MVICHHSADISRQLGEGVTFIEDMLHQQLVAAMGKELQPQDFAVYTQFHNHKLFMLSDSLSTRRDAHRRDGLQRMHAQSWWSSLRCLHKCAATGWPTAASTEFDRAGPSVLDFIVLVGRIAGLSCRTRTRTRTR